METNETQGAGAALGPGWAVRFAGAGALVLFLCWQHVQATRVGYRVEEERRQAAERRGRVAALRLELDRLLSPAQVAVRAARLGMVPASPDALRRLPERGAFPLAGSWRALWSRQTAGAAPWRG